jgi:hypothetical protein
MALTPGALSLWLATLLAAGPSGAPLPSAECVTEGPLPGGRFDLTLEGVAPFTLEVTAAAWARVVLRERTPSTIEIRGPHLTVSAPGTLLHHLVRPVTTAGGLLALARNAPVSGLHHRGRTWQAATELDDEIVVGAVEVPCDTLAPGEPPPSPPRR